MIAGGVTKLLCSRAGATLVNGLASEHSFFV